MHIYCKDSDRIWTNAEFILQDLAEGKPGESIVFITDRQSHMYARALCDRARDLGMDGFIADVDAYAGGEHFANIPVMPPLKAAVLAADICFMLTPQMMTNFGTYLGAPDDCDEALLGKSRRFTLEAGGMEEWDLDRERVLADRRRTEALLKWCGSGRELHATTALGTDFTCKIGDRPDGMYPVLGILPFYAEVAIIPNMGGVTGTFVADGASELTEEHRGFPIRPAIPGYQELYKQPLRITLTDSMVVDYDGDPVQIERLRNWMEGSTPPANVADEVGLVTTTSIENDRYGWAVDRTHQTHTIHVAVGNNHRRGEIIHGKEHVDFDIHDPTLAIDGQVFCTDGVFDDDVIFGEH